MGLTDSHAAAQGRAREFNSERLVEQCSAQLRQPTTTFVLTDEEREVLIRYHRDSAIAAPMCSGERRSHGDRMVELVNSRSQTQIERMERKLGLRG